MRAALFDFDGTLADTAPDMVAALEDWCRAAGLPAPAPARARLRVSQGARGLLELAGVDGDGPGFAAARKEYLRLYEATGHRRTRLFAGVDALREKLRAAGTPWGIVTNKPRRYLEPVLRALDLAGARVVFAGDDCARAKPHPDSLLAACRALEIAPADVLYAGDDARDEQAAAAAGMPFALAAWGYCDLDDWRAPRKVAAVCATPVGIAAVCESLPAGSAAAPR